MREITFRGKAVDKRYGWVYGYLEVFRNAMGKSTAVIHDFNDWNLNGRTEVEIDSVGQFTGFLTNNGNKQIYEGDILRGKIREGFGVEETISHCIGLVFWEDEEGKWKIKDIPSGELWELYDYEPCDEITGNKWDNPEILND